MENVIIFKRVTKEEAEKVQGRKFLLDSDATIDVPPHLKDRMVKTILSQNTLGLKHIPGKVNPGVYHKEEFVAPEGGYEIRGTDVLLIGDVLVEFKPLVKLANDHDMYFLIRTSNSRVIGNCMLLDKSSLSDDEYKLGLADLRAFADCTNA